MDTIDQASIENERQSYDPMIFLTSQYDHHFMMKNGYCIIYKKLHPKHLKAYQLNLTPTLNPQA